MLSSLDKEVVESSNHVSIIIPHKFKQQWGPAVMTGHSEWQMDLQIAYSQYWHGL